MNVKNLSEVVVLGCKAFAAYEESRKDGKIDAADILYLIPVAQAIKPALEDINLVPAEALDLDAAEMDELLAIVMAEIPSLKTKVDALIKVKAVVKLLLAAKDCYNAFSAKPLAVGVAAIAANSFEGESEGVAKAALRADDSAAKQNLAAAVGKREAIAAARAADEAKVAAAAEPAVAEKVADAKAAGDSLAAHDAPAPGN